MFYLNNFPKINKRSKFFILIFSVISFLIVIQKPIENYILINKIKVETGMEIVSIEKHWQGSKRYFNAYSYDPRTFIEGCWYYGYVDRSWTVHMLESY
jgi:hypothetical protein